jgi:hypothetical protein
MAQTGQVVKAALHRQALIQVEMEVKYRGKAATERVW